MNAAQLPFLVEGILILIAMLFGALLGRKKKPYGKVKLVIHLFLYAWFTTGFVFIVLALSAAAASALTWIFVVVMGAAIAAQLLTGVWMMAARQPLKRLPAVHITSASVMLLCAAGAFVSTGLA